jgi:hypothetical protein
MKTDCTSVRPSNRIGGAIVVWACRMLGVIEVWRLGCLARLRVAVLAVASAGAWVGGRLAGRFVWEPPRTSAGDVGLGVAGAQLNREAGMRVALRSLLVCVLGCMIGLLWLAMPVYAEEGLPVSGGSESLEGSPLAPPALEVLAGSERGVEEEARRASPEAVVAREVSAHAYKGLGIEPAEQVAAKAFPSLVDRANGALPALPSGQKLTGFASPYAAELSELDGQRAMAVSLAPMALETSSGSFTR